jgi:hypothetical protein
MLGDCPCLQSQAKRHEEIAGPRDNAVKGVAPVRTGLPEMTGDSCLYNQLTLPGFVKK